MESLYLQKKGDDVIFPIGIQDFAKIREAGFVYVDKTASIYRLVTEGTVCFLSRPRRFGKSLLVSTLKYYFQRLRLYQTHLSLSAAQWSG